MQTFIVKEDKYSGAQNTVACKLVKEEKSKGKVFCIVRKWRACCSKCLRRFDNSEDGVQIITKVFFLIYISWTQPEIQMKGQI